jgi:hypothetical protein
LTAARNPSKMSSRSAPSQLIRKTYVFLRLVHSLDAFPKKFRISFRVAMSCFLGLTKIAASSAYKEAFIPLDLVVV